MNNETCHTLCDDGDDDDRWADGLMDDRLVTNCGIGDSLEVEIDTSMMVWPVAGDGDGNAMAMVRLPVAGFDDCVATVWPWSGIQVWEGWAWAWAWRWRSGGDGDGEDGDGNW